MKKALFVCIHNSARSQMAEAFLNSLGAGQCVAESAGLEPGTLVEQVAERASDGPPAQKADPDRLAHWSLAIRSSQLSLRTTTSAVPSSQKITGGLGIPL